MKETIMDICITDKDRIKVLNFLQDIYSTPFDKPKIWEEKIFKFFSQELIVPYILSLSTEENDEEIDFIIKESFFNDNRDGLIIIFNTSELYESLIKIKESLNVGVSLRNYLPFLFKNNVMVRSMCVKQTDEEDTRFNNFKAGFESICYETTTKDGEKLWERVYFILPDRGVTYPLEEWHSEIVLNWRKKLKGLTNKKIEKKRNPIVSKLRHEVFKRDSYKCKECSKNKEQTTLHVDHIIPISQGGSDELSNLQTLCEPCNLAKSNRKWVGGINETI